MSNRKRLVLDKAGTRAYARLASEIAIEIERAMKESSVNRAEIARRSGMNKAALTRALDGTRNLELRTVAAILGSLGYVMSVKSKPFHAPPGLDTNRERHLFENVTKPTVTTKLSSQEMTIHRTPLDPVVVSDRLLLPV